MGTRTVRLDEEAEITLNRLRTHTGLSISELLKRGLKAFETQAKGETQRKPYDIFTEFRPPGVADKPPRFLDSGRSGAGS